MVDAALVGGYRERVACKKGLKSHLGFASAAVRDEGSQWQSGRIIA
jgi:hypothetical protein